jgi:hypothetical protein
MVKMVGPWSPFYSVEDLNGSEKVASRVAILVFLLVLHEDHRVVFANLRHFATGTELGC